MKAVKKPGLKVLHWKPVIFDVNHNKVDFFRPTTGAICLALFAPKCLDGTTRLVKSLDSSLHFKFFKAKKNYFRNWNF